MNQPTINATITIELDGEKATTKEITDSLHYKTTYRIDRDELAEALERGHLDVTVVVEHLDNPRFHNTVAGNVGSVFQAGTISNLTIQ